MPTNKPRFMVTVSDEMYHQIDDYRFKNKCRSQTQAINELIEKGLQALLGSVSDDMSDLDPAISADPMEEHTPADANEKELISIYRDLNATGQGTLMNMARSLNTNPDMKKGGVSNIETA